jgi:phage-related protein
MTQLNTTTWDGYVQLITIDLTAYGDDVYGFIDSSPKAESDVTVLPQFALVEWSNQVYQPVPFSVSGSQRGGENLVRPRISLPDFGAAMYVTLAGHGLAPGAPVTRYQALAADILANDPNAPIQEEQYLLNSVSFDGSALQLELATHLDYQRAKFPRHTMYRDEFPGLGSNLTR